MTTTKLRGRPRKLDSNAAARIAMELFWEHGYETVGIADLTKAMGIKPPSLYSAFGSKAGVLEKAIEVYHKCASQGFAPAFAATTPDSFFHLLLQAAAKSYTDDPKMRGCLVLDGTRNTKDPAALEITEKHRLNVRAQIKTTLESLGCEDADIHADACITAMVGLSGSARHGATATRLTLVAKLLSHGLSAAVK